MQATTSAAIISNEKITADAIDNVIGTQAGSDPLHWPLAWHVRLAPSVSMYPSSHTYVATSLYWCEGCEYDTLPFPNSLSAGQVVLPTSQYALLLKILKIEHAAI